MPPAPCCPTRPRRSSPAASPRACPSRNTTDGSTSTVLTVDSETQITLATALSGGAANAFAAGDAYAVGEVPFTALPADDYLVHVNNITDQANQPIYKFTREEDINIASGDSYVPQVPPPACVGTLHTVDVKDSGTDNYPAQTIVDPSGLGAATISVAASTPTDNPTFADPGMGGSPYEGQARPLCDTKLVSLQNGRSIVPGFNVFTDVPLPSRFFALNNDDLTFSTDPKSLLYGEKAGIPFSPVGIYDFANRLVTTSETDYNGLFDVLLPSTDRISCPTPSGVCGNVYRFVGNDPGVPGRLNPNYNPQYRTIAAEFEAWPGIIVPADTAPTQVGVTVQLPGTQTFTAVSCPVDPVTPQLFAVSRPYVDAATRSFTITGLGFGADQGVGQVTLDGLTVPTSAWSNTQITVDVPADAPVGPHQLKITAANGQGTVNGLTIHVLGAGYNPPVLEVGPGRTYAPADTLPATANHAIQDALDAAPAGALVVVYPNNPSVNPRQNPRGAYYENLIISRPVKLQGVGPGSPDGSVRGTIIDGGAFAGDSPVATDWYTRIGALTWAGNQAIYDGAVISIYTTSTAFPATFSAVTAPSIDGFDIRGGDQQGFPGNINAIGGGPTGAPAGLVTQGGAVFANAYARNLQITNNVVQNNGGAYGTIRIGTPDLPAPGTSNHNEGVRIANNRVIANGGTNLAGGIGLFAGSDGYAVTGNDICGNFSAEYGGGLTVYGYSPNGSIDHNRIYHNQSYDEGGGIMIAGELPADPSILSPGSGPVNVHENLIQGNLGNDDGGGLRFLMAGDYPINVYNNMIVNNVSTHEGGGIAIDDAPNVRVYNNTIMKNVTTATAVTSDGQPAPAGLSTGQNSALLQATLPVGASTFSNPLLFNDIFWDNRAGTRAGATVTGIGAAGDASPINAWDLGVASANPADLLAPTNSMLQSATGTVASPTNAVGVDPLVVSTYDTAVTFAAWRTNPNFVGAILVAADLPANLMGNYHLQATSVAKDAGAASKAVPASQQPPASLAAPTADIDGEGRPAFAGYDIGADEIPSVSANLGITKTDGLASVTAGAAVTYTIVVGNAGPSAVAGGTVTDTFPATLTVGSWTCTASAGSSCTVAGSGSGRTGTVTLANGGSATFTATTTLAAGATGTLSNTATVTPPAGITDPNTANNSATDSDTIVPAALPLPTLAVLDSFNRANANTLGGSWNQVTLLGAAAIRVNANRAFAILPGQANRTTTYGAKQGAAFTFATTPLTGSSLLLKVTNGAGSNNNPARYIRVQYQTTAGGRLLIQSTTNGNVLVPTFATLGTLASGAFATGDRLTAVANADGSVDAWKTTAGNVTTLPGPHVNVGLHRYRPHRHAAPDERPGRRLPRTDRAVSRLPGATRPIVVEGENAMIDRRRLLLTRRDLLKYGGLTAIAAGAAGFGPRLVETILQPAGARAADKTPDLKLVGTDGWISMPPGPAISNFHPDSYAPPNRTDYIFGFANATGLPDGELYQLKNKAQHSAPLFWAREGDDFRVQLTNVGLAQRPDLFDSHTLHWHGFKNVIPFFDGEPTGSVSIPQGQTFTYVYKSHDPGTYMFHCHVEDVEHVHMGMTGLVFVRPHQDGNTTLYASGRYAYNDGDGSTGFDREYAMFLSEVWAEAHWADAHIQLPEWSDYHADFSLLNGRAYPDTLEPNGAIFSDAALPNAIYPFQVVRNASYDLVPPTGSRGVDLGNQPMSSLITCVEGERVLLRFANLGFKEAAMTLSGIKLRVVGRDATLLRGRDATNSSYATNTVALGAGESFDAIFTAPAFATARPVGDPGYDTYVLYNRTYIRADNLAGGGGQRTEVRVYPAGGALNPQRYPNDWSLV